MKFSLSDIPKKTDLGKQQPQEKIAVITHEHRRLLVMVDGKKNIKQLLAFEKIFGGISNLEDLIFFGYVNLTHD